MHSRTPALIAALACGGGGFAAGDGDRRCGGVQGVQGAVDRAAGQRGGVHHLGLQGVVGAHLQRETTEAKARAAGGGGG